MKLLAISGSTRAESTNTYLLKEIAYLTANKVQIDVFNSHDLIPIFNQDKEGKDTPNSVLALCEKITACDGIIICSPEYVRAIPGALKNTIDWLVSRNEIIKKPISLVHASHRGDDVLHSLRLVLSTISENFSNEIFLQIPLIGKQKDEIKEITHSVEFEPKINEFISDYVNFIKSVPTSKFNIEINE